MASSNPVLALVFLLLTTFYHLGEGRAPHRFLVGGSDGGWKVPESPDTLIHWAETQRFLVGDSIEFNYDGNKDSVFQVTKEDYEKCITEKSSKKYTSNQTILKLDVSGPHYFISGNHDNCVKGEKLIVVVQSPNHPPMPKPVPATAPPTPSKPPTTPAPAPPTPSKPPTTPAPAPSNNTAVGLVAGSGIFWTSIAVIGLAWA